MKLSKQNKTLAAAIAAALLGLAGNAHATAYSYATYDLQNFKININGAFQITDPGKRNTENTASFTGYPSSTLGNEVVPPAASDALQATSGPGAFPGENFFGTWWVNKPAPANMGVYQNGSGARADSWTAAGSGLNQAGNGVPHVQAVAESLVPTSGGVADENAKNTFSAKINVAANTTLNFSGLIDYRVIAMTDNPPPAGSTSYAQSFVSSQFRISDANGLDLFTYDPFTANNMQRACASTNGSPANPFCDIAAVFGFNSNVYTSLVNQTLQINLEMAAHGHESVTVPEPASIALLGSGLIGLIGVRRRQRKSQD